MVANPSSTRELTDPDGFASHAAVSGQVSILEEQERQ
jgi:hypothetical protein